MFKKTNDRKRGRDESITSRGSSKGRSDPFPVVSKEEAAPAPATRESAKKNTKKAAVQALSKKSIGTVAQAATQAAASPSSTATYRAAPPPIVPAVPKHLDNALLFAGTVHSILAALVLKQNKFLLKFSVKRHVGCVNCVAVCDKYVATAGTDERLFLFTLKDRGAQAADLGSLAPANEVRSLCFHKNQFLLCGCSDGTVAVYRCRDWESILAVQVHDKGIESIALHPSGTLAVSVGLDRHVALLDMERGKLITRCKLDALPTKVFFEPISGNRFVVATSYALHVFDTRTSVLLCTIKVPKQPPNEIHAACFVASSDRLLLIGCEDGSIRLAVVPPAGALGSGDAAVIVEDVKKLSIDNVPEEIAALQQDVKTEAKKKYPTSHATRIKDMVFSGDSLITADANGCVIASIVVVVKSNGEEDSVSLNYRCSANCQGRLTSVALLQR